MSGHERERGHVTWANDVEVTAVEGGDVFDAETLGRGDDRRIDRAEREIAIRGDELGHSQPVAGGHVIDGKGAAGEVSEEPDLRFDPEARGEQIRHLGDDQDRDDEGTRVRLEEIQARFVMGIVGIDVGVQRPRVDEQCRYRCASAARISSMRCETSLRPLRPALAAPSRRRPAPPTR